MLTQPPRPHPAIIVSILAAVCGCHGAPPPPAIPIVSSGTVGLQTDYLGERYSTSVNPNAQVQLMFKSAGIVNYIRKVRGGGRLIGAGDPIVAGEELARVRSTEYEAQLHQQQSQVVQADAQLAAAQAAETQARLNYDRANILFSQASLTKPTYDQARSTYDQAVASVQQAKAAGATARAAVAQVEVTVGDTAVRAPFNGSIAQRNIDIGDLAGPSNAAFTIIDTHVVKAVFSVPESALSSRTKRARHYLKHRRSHSLFIKKKNARHSIQVPCVIASFSSSLEGDPSSKCVAKPCVLVNALLVI